MTFDPRPWISVSAYKSITYCGEQFRLERVEKIPSRPAAWTVRGIAAHAAIERWEGGFREEDPQVLVAQEWDKALAEITGKFPDLSQWIRTPRVTTTEKDLEYRKRDAEDQVLGYVTTAFEQEDDWQVHVLEDGRPAIELEFFIDFEDLRIPGRIDMLLYYPKLDVFRVRDLKTGSDKDEDSRQLGAYAYACNSYYDLPVTQGEYWYSKLNRPSALYEDLDKIYTYNYLHDVYKEVMLIKKHGHFVPNPSKDKCQMFCGVREHCREWSFNE